MRQSEHDRVATLRWLWGAGLGSSLSVPNADEFSTPLHMAMAARDEAAGWWLIEHGADVIRLVVGKWERPRAGRNMRSIMFHQRATATNGLLLRHHHHHQHGFQRARYHLQHSVRLHAHLDDQGPRGQGPDGAPDPSRADLGIAPTPPACAGLAPRSRAGFGVPPPHLTRCNGRARPLRCRLRIVRGESFGKGTYSQLSSILKFYRVLIYSSNAG